MRLKIKMLEKTQSQHRAHILETYLVYVWDTYPVHREVCMPSLSLWDACHNLYHTVTSTFLSQPRSRKLKSTEGHPTADMGEKPRSIAILFCCIGTI